MLYCSWQVVSEVSSVKWGLLHLNKNSFLYSSLKSSGLSGQNSKECHFSLRWRWTADSSSTRVCSSLLIHPLMELLFRNKSRCLCFSLFFKETRMTENLHRHFTVQLNSKRPCRIQNAIVLYLLAPKRSLCWTNAWNLTPALSLDVHAWCNFPFPDSGLTDLGNQSEINVRFEP